MSGWGLGAGGRPHPSALSCDEAHSCLPGGTPLSPHSPSHNPVCCPLPPALGPAPSAGGEVDVRGCYCALAACEMLGLDKGAVAAACNMPDFIRRCQVNDQASSVSSAVPASDCMLALQSGSGIPPPPSTTHPTLFCTALPCPPSTSVPRGRHWGGALERSPRRLHFLRASRRRAAGTGGVGRGRDDTGWLCVCFSLRLSSSACCLIDAQHAALCHSAGSATQEHPLTICLCVHGLAAGASA